MSDQIWGKWGWLQGDWLDSSWDVGRVGVFGRHVDGWIDMHLPPKVLSSFSPASINEIAKLWHASPNKHCDLDPIPTVLLKQVFATILPIITTIVNLSLSTGTFPHVFQAIPCYLTPKKNPSLDKDKLNNYRPISNLRLISKITERIIKSRLNKHLSSNSLYNPNQSAYTKYHSTETTLLSLHDHLIIAISHQQVSCLCLLDLSAAFDTIDHSILLHRSHPGSVLPTPPLHVSKLI